jgi:hypothetical protein
MLEDFIPTIGVGMAIFLVWSLNYTREKRDYFKHPDVYVYTNTIQSRVNSRERNRISPVKPVSQVYYKKKFTKNPVNNVC